MAVREITKSQRVCDVTGGTRKVQCYRIYVSPGEDGLGAEPPVLDQRVDLAPRALERLLNFIRRGLQPVGKGSGVAATAPAQEPPAPPEDLAPPSDPSEFDKQLEE